MKDVMRKLGYTTIDGRKIIGFVGVLQDPETSGCLDCGHKSMSHAEYAVEGCNEAEVVCPECGSLNYYVEG
jgi:hypothetical protein